RRMTLQDMNAGYPGQFHMENLPTLGYGRGFITRLVALVRPNTGWVLADPSRGRQRRNGTRGRGAGLSRASAAALASRAFPGRAPTWFFPLVLHVSRALFRGFALPRLVAGAPGGSAVPFPPFAAKPPGRARAGARHGRAARHICAVDQKLVLMVLSARAASV